MKGDDVCVEVYINNNSATPHAVYPLNVNIDKEEIKSEKGVLYLYIKNGEVWVTDADCPDKVCEGMRIKNGRGQIVCSPHLIVIRLSSRPGEDISG